MAPRRPRVQWRPRVHSLLSATMQTGRSLESSQIQDCSSGKLSKAFHTSTTTVTAVRRELCFRKAKRIRITIIGASLSEPHIDRTSGRFPYIMVVVVRPSSARRVRPHEDQEVDRKSPTCLHLPTSLSVSSHLLYLSTVAVYLSTLAVCSMSSTNHQRASATNQRRASAPRTPESETDKRERLLQRRRERERDRRDSETAVQREERLSRRRMRD